MSMRFFISCILTTCLLVASTQAQHSVARQWNDILLEAIRKDFARPTVHARNLFHVSVVMYDAWAAYDEVAKPFMLGDSLGDYYTPFLGTDFQNLTDQARINAKNEAISYAAYRVLKHRFQNSPGASFSLPLMDTLFAQLGYNPNVTSLNYQNGSPAALGNYIAHHMIQFGLQDGANEQNDYANLNYSPQNQELFPAFPGNPTIIDPNRWQPLSLDTFIAQSGNPYASNTPSFLSAEWAVFITFHCKTR